MTINDIEIVKKILRNGAPETAITRVNDYIRERKIDAKDFQVILAYVDIFLHKEVQRNNKRMTITKISLVLSCVALAVAVLAIVIRICR